MSDCKNGGRSVYVKPMEQATIRRMCQQFGEPPWTYPVDKPECWPDEAVELIDTLVMAGVRFERVRFELVRECEFELNTDMTAIRCDKCGYELPKGTDLMATMFCGGCGARVKEGGE